MLILCRIAIAKAGKPYRKIPLINCLFQITASVCLHSRSSPLHADWRKSDSSVDGQPQGNWRRNSNSKGVVVRDCRYSKESIFKSSEGWGKGVLEFNDCVVRYYCVFTSPIIHYFSSQLCTFSLPCATNNYSKIITKNAH